MSSIVNKIKDAVSGDKHHESPEGTHGPHSSKAANAADPRIDSDRDHRGAPGSTIGGTHGTAGGLGSTGTHGTTGTHAPTGTLGAGTHGHTSGASHTTAGPHGSDALNKIDPRVDSDLDGSRTAGGNNYGSSGIGSTGTHGTHGTSGLTGTTGTHGTHGTHGTSGLTGTHGTHTEGTHGPHSSNIANAADPRVDSDRDGSRTVGGNNYGSSGIGSTGTHGTHGTSGLTGTTGTHGHTGTSHSTAGPHGSDALNKLDPRVDSDRDGSRTAGGNNYGSSGIGSTGTHGTHGTSGLTGTTGTHGTHGTSGLTGTTGTHSEGSHGPHSSKVANAADPRVDSDRDGSRTAGGNNYGSTGVTGSHGTHAPTGTTHGLTTGTGPAPNTAGPHKSDFLNKADPRVDSDLDGSKTVGGNKTYGS